MSAHRALTGSDFIRDSVTQEQFETIVAKIEKHIELQHEQITIPEKAAVMIDGKQTNLWDCLFSL